MFLLMRVVTLGDMSYGLVTYAFTGLFAPTEIAVFLIASLLAAVIFVMAFTLFHSPTFWPGNASGLAELAANALLTLALAAIVITGVSCTMFYAGLRRYESGSVLKVNV